MTFPVRASAPPGPGSDNSLAAFKDLTRRTAVTTAARFGYCAPGLNQVLRRLRLPLVQGIRTVQAEVVLHPDSHQGVALLTEPAGVVHVALALQEIGFRGGHFTGLTADQATTRGTFVTAQLTIPVRRRIAGVTPTEDERNDAAEDAAEALLTISVPYNPITRNRPVFRARITEILGVTVADHPC